MAEKEAEMIRQFASWPESVQDKFLEMARGATIALDALLEEEDP